MTNSAAPQDADPVPATYEPPPPMPSIAASALGETRALIALTRRTIASLVARG